MDGNLTPKISSLQNQPRKTFPAVVMQIHPVGTIFR